MASNRRSVQREVVEVIDGDTLKVDEEVDGSRIIRVSGMDSPEKGERGYETAKMSLSKLKGKRVTLTPRGKSYGRTVADVTYEGKRYSGST